MKKLIVLIFSMMLMGACYADNIYSHPLNESNEAAFKQVQVQLSKADNLSGEFSQIRKMRLLSSPLKSSGHFVLSKSKGLQWNQSQPFKSSLIVTNTKIEQRIEDTPPTIITQKQQPIVFSFTHIFLSVFNGNTAAITGYFDIYFSGDTKAWKLALKPINTLLQKAITSIEMTGGKYVQTVTINEVKQNQMTMRFSNVKELN